MLAKDIGKKRILENERALDTYIKRNIKTHLLGYFSIYDLSGNPIKSESNLEEVTEQVLFEKTKTLIKNKDRSLIIPTI
jgi:uncharacterized protein YajQ (UPF0234 family)